VGRLCAPAGSTLPPDSAAARGRARFWLGMGTLLAVLVGLQLLGPQELLYPLVARTRGAGWTGAALLGLLHVPAALLGVPLALLTFTAGWFYGPAIGALIAVPACTAASCAAYTVGRVLSGHPRFLARGRGELAAMARAMTTGKGHRPAPPGTGGALLPPQLRLRRHARLAGDLPAGHPPRLRPGVPGVLLRGGLGERDEVSAGPRHPRRGVPGLSR